MRDLLEQIERGLEANVYYLSLFASLAIPDICGAIDSLDGEASGAKYVEWYDKWVAPRFNQAVQATLPKNLPIAPPKLENPLTGDACYRFRCSLLHQGSTQHPKSPFSRILFIEPGSRGIVVHHSILNDALCIDIRHFCAEVLAGTRMWLAEAEGTQQFRTNYDRCIKLYPNGLAPYISGLPVVG